MTRADWLDSLDPGDVVTLVARLGNTDIAYHAEIGTVDDDKIVLTLSTGIKSFVWCDTGCRPEFGWYIRPLDAPADYPNPLAEIATDWSAA